MKALVTLEHGMNIPVLTKMELCDLKQRIKLTDVQYVEHIVFVWP